MLGTLDLTRRDVTVVGGGIAGLSLAYLLDQKGYQVHLFESSRQPGGLIRSIQTPWGIVENAVHSVIATRAVQRLCDEMGVQLIEVHPDSRARWIFREGRLRRVPLSFTEGVAVLFRSLFCTLDSSSEDLTVEDWAKGYLGQPALDYLISPMVSGIYGSQPSLLNVSAAFPEWKVPRCYSLLGYRLVRTLKKPIREWRKKMSPIVAPVEGMSALTQALSTRLQARLGDRFVTGFSVNELPQNSGTLILATPADVAGNLLQNKDPNLAQALQSIQYTPLISVTAFLAKDGFQSIPKGIGVLVPEKENRNCLGILFNSSAFPNRVTSPDWVSVTVILGGSAHPEILTFSDDRIYEIVRTEVGVILGYRGRMECKIQRWKRAIPLYNQFAVRAWKNAQEGWCSKPGRILFGNYTGQVSLRGMIESAYRLIKGTDVQ